MKKSIEKQIEELKNHLLKVEKNLVDGVNDDRLSLKKHCGYLLELYKGRNEHESRILSAEEQINTLKSELSNIDSLPNEFGDTPALRTIAKHVQNAESEIELLKAQNCNCHTNTQKENKNATTPKESGKKEYLETIVTNEMFNEELEKRLSESFIQDHPAFLLLNKDLDSNTIEDLIRAKLKSKGEHYSPNGDRYSNFKRLNNSTAKQKTVKERIENFMEKHEIWIEDYQAGDVNGTLLDLIESCIDVLDYYLLLNIYLKFNPVLK